jgi:hypothetical protein
MRGKPLIYEGKGEFFNSLLNLEGGRRGTSGTVLGVRSFIVAFPLFVPDNPGQSLSLTCGAHGCDLPLLHHSHAKGNCGSRKPKMWITASIGGCRISDLGCRPILVIPEKPEKVII